MKERRVSPIQKRLMEFIRSEFSPGHNHYSVSKLMGDASSRQYFRYTGDSFRSYILAVYPESFQVEDFAYGQICHLLDSIGIPVPEILTVDATRGIVLQQDLGNTTLRKAFLTQDADERRRWLEVALDYLVVIQNRGSAALPPQMEAFHLAFDEEKLNWEFSFFVKHYLQNYRRLEMDLKGLRNEFQAVSAELAAAPRVLCHRDYHVRNLMLWEDDLYVIDFQDARWGPACYDVASLLKDSINLAPDEVEILVNYYLERAGQTGNRSFWRLFNLMSVQRLLKALGTYAYQVIVRENFIYEQYMAGSLSRALQSLDILGEFPITHRLVKLELGQRTG